ncbi:MAG: shikimate dehydrogenase [Polyangiaceae bacterium]
MGTDGSSVRPRRFAVIGTPIAHSRSPALHESAYRALGLPHRYELRDVPASALDAALEELRDGTYDGYNVTAPYKVRVLPYVDILDASAALPECANTLVRAEDGTLTAVNTDVPALAAELEELGLTLLPDSRALVLGTGGTARAAIVALANLGFRHVVVRGRRADEGIATFARGLEAKVQGLAIECLPFVASATDARFACVIQATSAPDAARHAVSWKHLSESAIAFDVVYAGGRTAFLESAEERGLRCAGGIGMLVRQGALAFERWLGVPAPLVAMKEAVVI